MRTLSKSEKSARTRARKKNPLRAAKLVAKREVPAVKVFKISGREVCSKTPEGKTEYLKRTNMMGIRQGWLCGICLLPMNCLNATFDHENGRGMGGGHRDDRIEIDGNPVNRAVHGWCNSDKGSKRGYETTVRRTMRTTI